jgi:hypothetical protein
VNRRTYLQRRLHLVDIENLIGSARPTLRDAATCCERYAERAPLGPNDLVIVACNHGAATAVGYGWRGARVLLRSGRDGADMALLEVIAHENVTARFEAVVVASGDGCFAEAVAWLGSLGIEVTVVSNERALSRRLRLAAKHVVMLDADPVPAQPAAAARKAA